MVFASYLTRRFQGILCRPSVSRSLGQPDFRASISEPCGLSRLPGEDVTASWVRRSESDLRNQAAAQERSEPHSRRPRRSADPLRYDARRETIRLGFQHLNDVAIQTLDLQGPLRSLEDRDSEMEADLLEMGFLEPLLETSAAHSPDPA